MLSNKSKRKVKSWGYQSTASVWRGNLLATTNERDAIMASIEKKITKHDRDKGDTLNDWQEFVSRRQRKIDKDSQGSGGTSEHRAVKNQVNELLKEQPEEVSDAVTLLVLSATYMHYNKGFLDGLKIAVSMGNL